MTKKRLSRESLSILSIIYVFKNSKLADSKCQTSEFDNYLAGCGPACPARYIWDRATRQPIVVPEKAMDDFIRICGTMHEDLVYLTRVSSKLRLGQRVRVCSGPFEGVEGVVVRIRRSRRIMVELPGMLAVATTYVSPENVIPV